MSPDSLRGYGPRENDSLRGYGPTDSLRGYGPSKALMFTGQADDFELWSIKFKGYLRINKLHKVLESPSEGDEEKNAEIFAIMVQFLDDKSLNLIIRDATDKGREAYKILEEHYLGTSKPRIIALYCELTPLKMGSNDTVTDYVLRAETAASRLKQAGETISDALLIAMVLKGLPASYKAFSTIISNSDDKMTFPKFKISLRSYEENESARSAHGETTDEVFSFNCYRCGKPGHKQSQCNKRVPNNTNPNKSRGRWCENCKMTNHDTKYCRKRNATKNIRTKSAKFDNNSDNEDVFIFKISIHEKDSIYNLDNNNEKYLVDCGATAHIICNKSKFIEFDEDFDSSKHIIELADCSRQSGIVAARGTALIQMEDSKGINRDIYLKNALCIPTYNQDILSVHSMTEKGLRVNFSNEKNEIVTPNGTIFNMIRSGRLYFVKNLRSTNQELTGEDTTPKLRSLKEWHSILGHCNVPDILNLEKSNMGIKLKDKNEFQCKTCLEGKMSQSINHNLDAKAENCLDLVHSDLNGPIHPLSPQGSKYVINFVDDYSGLITVYFCCKVLSVIMTYHVAMYMVTVLSYVRA